VLQRHRKTPGLALDADAPTDDRAIAAVARITGGNSRPLRRLLNQIGRIPAINEMTTITENVVDTARPTLATGATQHRQNRAKDDADHTVPRRGERRGFGDDARRCLCVDLGRLDSVGRAARG
jgi:hypothetical protein